MKKNFATRERLTTLAAENAWLKADERNAVIRKVAFVGVVLSVLAVAAGVVIITATISRLILGS